MLKSGLSEESYNKLKEFHPVGNIGKASDLADLVFFLSQIH